MSILLFVPMFHLVVRSVQMLAYGELIVILFCVMCIPSNAVAAFVGFLLTCLFVSGGGSLRSMASGKRTQPQAAQLVR